MENVMTYGMESRLRLPSCYVEVSNNEMEYVDGGAWTFIVGWICNAVGFGLTVAGGIVGLAGGNASVAGGLALAGTVVGFAGSILTGVKVNK